MAVVSLGLLLAIQRGRVRRDRAGFMLDCYPRVDMDITSDALLAEREGLLRIGDDDTAGWRAVHLTDVGRARLEACTKEAAG